MGGGSGGAGDASPAAFSPMAADLSPLEDPEGTMRQMLQVGAGALGMQLLAALLL